MYDDCDTVSPMHNYNPKYLQENLLELIDLEQL